MTPRAQAVELALSKAVEQTLEQMAFAIAEPAPVATFALGARNVCWSRIEVSWPFAGSVELRLPRTLSAELAGSILASAVDPGDTPLLLDVMGEILNTITGSLLKELVDSDELFAMSVPTSGVDENYQHVANADAQEVVFSVEELPLLASWCSSE